MHKGHDYDFDKRLMPLQNDYLTKRDDRSWDRFAVELNQAIKVSVEVVLNGGGTKITSVRAQDLHQDTITNLLARFKKKEGYCVSHFYTVIRNEVVSALHRRKYSSDLPVSTLTESITQDLYPRVDSDFSFFFTEMDPIRVVMDLRAASFLSGNAYARCIKAISKYTEKRYIYKYAKELYYFYNEAKQMVDRNKKRKPTETERVGLLLHKQGLYRLRKICSKEGLFLSHVVDLLVSDFCDRVEALGKSGFTPKQP